MSEGQKRLEATRRNPQGDGRIEDVKVVCRAYGISFTPPNHPSQEAILTVPFARPIKAVYKRKPVKLVDAVQGAVPAEKAGR